jgi:hypothetical protein
MLSIYPLLVGWGLNDAMILEMLGKHKGTKLSTTLFNCLAFRSLIGSLPPLLNRC